MGILSGGSLFMWREFFGDKARIIGVDLNPNAKKWEEYGFEIYIGSQSDENFWRQFINKVGTVDIVLDDGGHTYVQQIVTTEMLLPIINDGGVLIVEDVCTSYMNGFGLKRYSFINYAKNLVDKINYRYTGLKENMEKRVWSIQFFESIVVFNINKQTVNLCSKNITNKGKDDLAEDYRYSKYISVKVIHKNLIDILKRIPGLRYLARKMMEITLIIKDYRKTKKYFM